MEKEKVTGIVLAGGKSSRMKKDKGLVKIGGKKFIEHILSALTAVKVDEIIIIANNSNYNHIGHHVFKDIIPGCGPVGGIYTGLRFSETQTNIILSCDIPFVTPELLKYLLLRSKGHEITVPIHKRIVEPLCGIYNKSCEEKFGIAAVQKNYKLQDVIGQFDLNVIEIGYEQFYNDRLLSNINTPEELKKYEELNYED